jgi:hypothetical protein
VGPHQRQDRQKEIIVILHCILRVIHCTDRHDAQLVEYCDLQVPKWLWGRRGFGSVRNSDE